jgi:hypothetical protein
VVGAVEEDSRNGCDVSCSPLAEGTGRRLGPRPGIGRTVITRRRRACSDAERCRHLRPGDRLHIITSGDILALGRHGKHTVQAGKALYSEASGTEPSP